MKTFKGTKSELLEQRNELLEALQDLMDEVFSDIEGSDVGFKNVIWKKCEKAINKAL